MNINLTKKDIWLALLAGEIVAWLSLPTLKNLKVLDILAGYEINLIPFIIFWAIFVPLGALAGLVTFYFIGKVKNRVGFFQLGKYGVIGVLNTLLNAGIYNLLIFMTDISSGLVLDSFFVVAFIITVANSFFWNKYWSFEEKKSENIKSEAVQFFSVSAAVAVINIALLHMIVNAIG